MPYRKTERSERAHAATRERILKAAYKLFAKRGYHATTMQEIVRASATSIGNVYFYFKDKGDLLNTLLERTLTAGWARGDEAMAQVPAGPMRLTVMLYANAAGLHRDRGLTQLITDTGEAAVEEQLIRLNAPRVRRLIRENFPDYPEDDLTLAVTAWTGTTRNIVRMWAKGTLTESPRVITAFGARWNLRGLGVAEAEIDAAIVYGERTFFEAEP